MLQMHEAHVSSVSQLRRGLSQRQLNMIALGGVIVICVPVNPVDTGQAERTGPVFVLDATVAAAHERLDAILAAIRDIGLPAGGELGDYRPLRALAAAVKSFQPDQLVIAEARPSWLRLGLVDKARAAYPIPVTHVVSRQRAVDLAIAPLQAT
jgi:GABA permease